GVGVGKLQFRAGITPSYKGVCAHGPRTAVDHSSSAFYTHRFLFRGLANGIEAYISAEQPAPQADSRFPGPHAHQGRAARPLAPPPQGPQAPRGLTRALAVHRWKPAASRLYR